MGKESQLLLQTNKEGMGMQVLKNLEVAQIDLLINLILWNIELPRKREQQVLGLPWGP